LKQEILKRILKRAGRVVDRLNRWVGWRDGRRIDGGMEEGLMEGRKKRAGG